MSDIQLKDAPITGAQEGTGGFIWYELMTTDPEGAKAFYGAIVGWAIGDPMPGPVEYRMIGRDDGGHAGGVLTINDEMANYGTKPTWLGYVHVADVDETSRSFEHAGGKVHMAPSDIPNVGRIAMVSDPQGATLYVMHPTPPDPNAQSDVFSPTALQRCGWNELSTTDEKAARQFYGERFGWTSDDFMPMGEMGEYRFLNRGDEMIGAVFNTPDGRPRWRFYFRVPSISAAKDAIERNGGTIATGPREVPGGDHVIVGFDPQGAEFALVGGQ